MTTLMMIIGACMVGLGIGLMDSKNRTTNKPRRSKSDWSLKSYWKSLDDHDMNYGTLSMEKRKRRN